MRLCSKISYNSPICDQSNYVCHDNDTTKKCSKNTKTYVSFKSASFYCDLRLTQVHSNPQSQRQPDLTLKHRLKGFAGIVNMSPFRQQSKNLCRLGFIVDWRVQIPNLPLLPIMANCLLTIVNFKFPKRAYFQEAVAQFHHGQKKIVKDSGRKSAMLPGDRHPHFSRPLVANFRCNNNWYGIIEC